MLRHLIVFSLGLSLLAVTSCGLPRSETQDQDNLTIKAVKAEDFNGAQFIQDYTATLNKIFAQNSWSYWPFSLEAQENNGRLDLIEDSYYMHEPSEGFQKEKFSQILFFGLLNKQGAADFPPLALVILANAPQNPNYTGVIFYANNYPIYQKAEYVRFKNNGQLAQMMVAFTKGFGLAEFTNQFVNPNATPDANLTADGRVPETTLAAYLHKAINEGRATTKIKYGQLINQKFGLKIIQTHKLTQQAFKLERTSETPGSYLSDLPPNLFFHKIDSLTFPERNAQGLIATKILAKELTESNSNEYTLLEVLVPYTDENKSFSSVVGNLQRITVGRDQIAKP